MFSKLFSSPTTAVAISIMYLASFGFIVVSMVTCFSVLFSEASRSCRCLVWGGWSWELTIGQYMSTVSVASEIMADLTMSSFLDVLLSPVSRYRLLCMCGFHLGLHCILGFWRGGLCFSQPFLVLCGLGVWRLMLPVFRS